MMGIMMVAMQERDALQTQLNSHEARAQEQAENASAAAKALAAEKAALQAELQAAAKSLKEAEAAAEQATQGAAKERERLESRLHSQQQVSFIDGTVMNWVAKNCDTVHPPHLASNTYCRRPRQTIIELWLNKAATLLTIHVLLAGA